MRSLKALAEDFGAELFLLTLCLAAAIIFLSSCGYESNDADPLPPPAPRPGPGPGPQGDPAWDELKPLVVANCGGCHNGTTHPLKFDSGAAFKRSKAKARISNGTMPPSGALAPDVKAKMLAYLG
jgi:hypothetical protein